MRSTCFSVEGVLAADGAMHALLLFVSHAFWHAFISFLAIFDPPKHAAICSGVQAAICSGVQAGVAAVLAGSKLADAAAPFAGQHAAMQHCGGQGVLQVCASAWIAKPVSRKHITSKFFMTIQ